MSDAIKIAERLADEFRPRAAGYDRSGEFPAANYARMKEEGYLRAPAGRRADAHADAREHRTLVPLARVGGLPGHR